MKLVHLLPDLMSLYGDYGNVAILARYAAACGAEVEICRADKPEAATLAEADVLYLGPGTEPARNAALEALRPVAGALKEAMDKGTVMLFTGNAVTLLGKTLTLADGTELEGLGLLDFTAEESKNRYTGDAIGTFAGQETELTAVGFLNRCDRLHGVEQAMFTLRMGKGNEDGAAEGVRAGNLWGTHCIGPVLVKNPALLREMGAALGLNGEAQAEQRLWREMEQAYQVTLGALEARLEQTR